MLNRKRGEFRVGPAVPAKRDLSVPTINPQEIVDYARGWLGIRWKHQGRGDGPNNAIDCAGLFVRTLENFGLPYRDGFGYGRNPDRRFQELIEACTLPGDPRGNYHGAVAIFSDKNMPCHVGFLAEDKGYTTVIHAESYPKMRVHESLLKGETPSMFDNLVDVRWLPGVKYVK